jgi:hypothetical protein
LSLFFFKQKVSWHKKKKQKKKIRPKPQPKSFTVPVKAKKLPNQNIDKKKNQTAIEKL